MKVYLVKISNKVIALSGYPILKHVDLGWHHDERAVGDSQVYNFYKPKRSAMATDEEKLELFYYLVDNLPEDELVEWEL